MLLVGAAIPSWALGSAFRAPSWGFSAHKQNQSICVICFFGWPLDGFACISLSATYQEFVLDKQPPSKSRHPLPKNSMTLMAIAEITDLGSNSTAKVL